MNNKNKLIVMFYSLSNVGGAEKNFVQLAQELHKKNAPKILILGGEINPSFNIKEFAVYNLTEKPNISKPISIVHSIVKIRKILYSFSVDKLEFVSFGPIYSFLAAITKIIMARRYKIRLTVCERNSISKKKESFLIKFARWTYLAQSDLITTNSEKNHQLIAKRGYTNSRLVRNYYEHGPLISKDISQDELSFVIVSRLEPQKRILETIKKLMETHIHNLIKVDIYGMGSEYDTLRQTINEFKKTNNIKININLHGFIPYHEIAFQQYDLSLHFSEYEGASNSMIEALLNGIPVVCSTHHVEEVDFLIPGENCFVCCLDKLNVKITEIVKWQRKLSGEIVRSVTLEKLERHPLIHELILKKNR